MNRVVGIGIFVLTMVTASWAAYDLKAALQSMVTAPQEIRLVWAKGGLIVEEYGVGSSWSPGKTLTGIYAVSSVDGVIRKIYPAGTTVGNYHCVNISDDGTRVVFWDSEAGEVIVIGFDGTFIRKFGIKGGYAVTGMYDYYYDATTKTDWVIISDDNTVAKVNIDLPSSSPTIIVTTAQMKTLEGPIDAPQPWIPNDDIGGTISDDGKWLVCANNKLVKKGMMDITNGTFVAGVDGCHAQMRGGLTGANVQFSQNYGENWAPNCTNNQQASDHHRGPDVFGITGKAGGIKEFHCVSDTLDKVGPSLTLAGCTHFSRADGLRWLRNSDYFSMFVYSTFGPILWRAHDNKWIYIERDVPCNINPNGGAPQYKNTFMGDMDGQIKTPPWGSTVILKNPLELKPTMVSTHLTNAETYSIDGRLIKNDFMQRSSRVGIIISKSTSTWLNNSLH